MRNVIYHTFSCIPRIRINIRTMVVIKLFEEIILYNTQKKSILN